MLLTTKKEREVGNMIKKEDLLIEMELLRDTLNDYLKNGFNEDSYMILNHHLVDTQNAMRGYFARFPQRYVVTILEDDTKQVQKIKVSQELVYANPKRTTK